MATVLQRGDAGENICYIINYFFAAKYNATNQPTIVQPKIQLAKRTKPFVFLSFFVCFANHAGAIKITIIRLIDKIYFKNTINICIFILLKIKGGFLPPMIPKSLWLNYIPYFADLSSSSSIRINWLYFAIRSVRDIEPVLI